MSATVPAFIAHRDPYGTGSDGSFTNLFRLLDDFNTYNRAAQGEHQDGTPKRRSNPTFSPKFDARETEMAYELYGELPGINREQVIIEFTDPQTIVIRGRVERNYSSGTPRVAAAITEKAHRASVADEESEKAKEQGETQVAWKSSPIQRPTKPAANEKYLVSERAIGEFHRTFGFPARIDQDGVVARLEQGLLMVVLPKAKKVETRRIAIN